MFFIKILKNKITCISSLNLIIDNTCLMIWEAFRNI